MANMSCSSVNIRETKVNHTLSDLNRVTGHLLDYSKSREWVIYQQLNVNALLDMKENLPSINPRTVTVFVQWASHIRICSNTLNLKFSKNSIFFSI